METSAHQLAGRTAAVTGGNSGIGLAIARAFRDAGARVAILGRNPDTLAKAADELGPDSVSMQGDVALPEDLDRFFDQVAAEFGGLDILVANVGIYEPAPFPEVDEAAFDRTCGVNFRGTFFTVQRALPCLRDGASVILVTSTANESGVPGLSVYSATKAAVRSLARTLAAELQPRGIRVNALSPGMTDTPIFERIGLTGSEVEAMQEAMNSQIPMGRFGRPEEIAAAALFLASDASSYITGVELPVSGGLGQI